jgi:hypothetical protein
LPSLGTWATTVTRWSSSRWAGQTYSMVGIINAAMRLSAPWGTQI